MPAISAGVSTRRPTARPGHREVARPQRDARAGAVRVLAQHEVVAQARLRGGVAADRRDVPGLLAEQALVGIAEERDRVVAADDRRRNAARDSRPVGVDDALDLLGDEVLRERAGGLLAACCFSAATRASSATSTTTPSISGRRERRRAWRGASAAGHVRRQRDLRRVGQDHGLRCRLPAQRVRGVSVVSVTPVQLVTPFATVDGELAAGVERAARGR